MAYSRLRLIKRCVECIPKKGMRYVPFKTRGIYTLLNEMKPERRQTNGEYKVVYVGMVGGKGSGIHSRLNAHAKKWPKEWTHFSYYEVWDNISDPEIEELEGLIRHMYREDKNVNSLNDVKKYGAFDSVTPKRSTNLQQLKKSLKGRPPRP